MSDSTQPVFTDDDSVEQEIEANENREVRPDEPVIERALDTVLSPLTRMIDRDELTPEEAAEAQRENNRDQHPE